MIGERIGHYEVLAALGAGGMGEVFRARDTRLQRDVAIKMLPARWMDDDATRARFEREARLLASLNHPHIAAIHGLEVHADRHFLVLEFVDGLDLDKRLRQGRMPIDECIAIARQIAEGVAAAHRQGIVHRDLKPSNVALTAEGNVKVLDFGLAKVLDPTEAGAPVSASKSPTVVAGVTTAGAILGTAAYMSPEQARGAPGDPRTDVWAYGCILFECLTGRRVFEAATVSDTIAAVLRDPVAFEELPSTAPPSLVRLLRRCLERDPERRLHALVDAGLDLDEAEQELRAGVALTPSGGHERSGVRRAIAWVCAGMVLGAAAAAAFLRPSHEAPSSRPLAVNRFTLVADSLDASPVSPPEISPDGRRIVYVAHDMLWVRELDRLDPVALAGTEGARGPFWAPDSQEVGFHRDRKILRTRLNGARPIVVCDTHEEHGFAGRASWATDDQIVFGSGDGAIYTVPATGGRAEVLVAVDPDRDDDFHTPSLLPDGRGVLFVSHRLNGGSRHLELFANGRRQEIWEAPGTGSVAFPVWDGSGHILLLREEETTSMLALPFSLDAMRVTGEPVTVVMESVVPSVSRDGTLVYVHGGPTGDHRIVRIGFDGVTTAGTLARGSHLDDAALSPSGKRLLYVWLNGSTNNVRVRDLARETETGIGTGSSSLLPFWIDERRVGVLETDSMRVTLYELDRAVPERTILRLPANHAFTRVSSPPSVVGATMVYTAQTANTQMDVWIASLDDPGTARPLIATAASELEPCLSPDGEYLAWTSDLSGRPEIYLAQLDAQGRLDARRWQVSSAGGETARWSPDGTRIYYATTSHLMEVRVERGAELELSRPRALFALSDVRVETLHGYSVDPSGTSLIMTQIGASAATPRSIVVVQNWAAELSEH